MKEQHLDVRPAERANVKETDFKEDIPYREDGSHSTDLEILCILSDTNVCCRVHKIRPTDLRPNWHALYQIIIQVSHFQFLIS
jgi:hypothetical protein